MKTTILPLALDTLDGGQFVADVNDALGELQETLLAFVDKYGTERTAGAKAKLTVEIVIGHDQAGQYSAASQIKTAEPARPKTTTVALDGEDQTERRRLLIPNAGQGAPNPRLPFRKPAAGDKVDQETGEVITSTPA